MRHGCMESYLARDLVPCEALVGKQRETKRKNNSVIYLGLMRNESYKTVVIINRPESSG